MLLELLQKGYGKAMGLNCALIICSCRRRHLKLQAVLAAVWVQVRPAALLPAHAWY